VPWVSRRPETADNYTYNARSGGKVDETDETRSPRRRQERPGIDTGRCPGRSRGLFERNRGANADHALLVLHPPDGASPFDAPIAVAGNLYGTTFAGGSYVCSGGCGTVFKLAPSGTETALYRFTGSAEETEKWSKVVRFSGVSRSPDRGPGLLPPQKSAWFQMLRCTGGVRSGSKPAHLFNCRLSAFASCGHAANQGCAAVGQRTKSLRDSPLRGGLPARAAIRRVCALQRRKNAT
jgi:uncharacterized repeat protein (TIGR03803 family)